MMIKGKAFAFSGSLLLACAGVAGMASAQQVLNVTLNQDIRGTNPGVDRDGPTDAVQGHVVEGLVAYASDFSVKPMLAESVEESEDGLTYTFRLRQGVKFHNGEEMTAEQVKWSWDRYMDPATGWRCSSYFSEGGLSPVAKFEVIDDYTVAFTLTAPSATFLGNLSRFDCGGTAVLHPDSVAADGSWVKPVGTGPFVFGDIAPGRFVDLVKFADYTPSSDPGDGYAGFKEAKFDRIRHHIIGDSSVRKTAFLAGELDVIDVAAEDLGEVESAAGVVLKPAETSGWLALLVNVRDPLLSDIRLRQAIAHGIDRKAIREVVDGGHGTVNPSVVPTIFGSHTDVQFEELAYDPERAKELMREAGYNGEDIVLQTGRSGTATYERALMVQAMLNGIGLNVKLELMEWGTQLELYQKGEYQLQSFSYSARMDPALSFEMITGEESRKVFRDPRAIELVGEATRVSDPEQRQAIIDELHRLFIEQVPAYSFGNTVRLFATKDDVTGFDPWGNYYPIYWGVGRAG